MSRVINTKQYMVVGDLKLQTRVQQVICDLKQTFKVHINHQLLVELDLSESEEKNRPMLCT